MKWRTCEGLRIWRSPQSHFYGDEAREAVGVYTDEVLAGIAAEGFNAIWLRGKLYDLVRRPLWPQLNKPHVDERLNGLQTVIARAQAHGLAVFLFFNEPLALAVDHPFWQAHPELAGEPYTDVLEHVQQRSLCTSQPAVIAFLRDALGQVFAELPGLGGVILITASEHHTHCWSHRFRVQPEDGFDHRQEQGTHCPRCSGREPSEVVAELVGLWTEAAARHQPRPRVLVWNWSWAMWYPGNAEHVETKLPPEAELLVDFERGGRATLAGRSVPIDEYSLAYVGPSETFRRFVAQADARRPFHAKIQINTTHELATVPNLPLVFRLLAKLRALDDLSVAGFMGCWNFGCNASLNTFLVRRYGELAPPTSEDEAFLRTLAREYFGHINADHILAAWRAFDAAFDHYPFSMPMLYRSPMNYAPAYPIRLHPTNTPMGPSWLPHDTWGDRLGDCFGPYSPAQVAQAFTTMAQRWKPGLDRYVAALSDSDPDLTLAAHRRQEQLAARAIDLHLRAMANLTTAERDREDQAARQAAMERQIQIAQEAIALAHDAPWLGYHQEPQAVFYDQDTLRRSIQTMQADLQMTHCPCRAQPDVFVVAQQLVVNVCLRFERSEVNAG